ncbi:MAG: cytochrome C biogenesis protein CcsB [Prochlorococcus sp. SP3034]|nr:cytochrome C biogenesis protein CcsB [Prochlorococcus sp. SP3034]
MVIFINRLLAYISNLKFAIALIIFIAIASSLGTLIPQGNDTSSYIEMYKDDPFIGILDGEKILIMGLDHIYTNQWFIFTLVLLCISLAACSFRRQIPSLKSSLKWIDYKNKNKFKKLQLACDWVSNNSQNTILNADKLLQANGWNSLVKDNRISARKGLIGKLGPIIVHIGLIILLVGSAYGNLANQSKEIFLTPNEEIELINDSNNKKLTLKLKNFFIERESDGKPKQFVSSLNFKSENSNNTHSKITKVNHPIRYQGLTIYQADWAISSVVLKIENITYKIQLKPIPEIGEQIWGILIELGSKNNNKKNYLLTIDNENGPVKFYDQRNLDETNLYLDNKSVEINSSNVEIVEIIKSSGLIIKNDPSIPFIYFSFILIILGTTLSVMPTKQLWILTHAESKKIYMGGLSNRNLAGFRNEFINLSSQLRNS